MAIYERVVTRPQPLWLTIGICLLILVSPLAAAWLDDSLGIFFSEGNWRHFLTAPVVIVYILLISRWLADSDSDLIKAFRPLAMVDDETFDQVVRTATYIKPISEILVLAIGIAIGFLISLPSLGGLHTFWLRLFVPLSLCLMWGLLIWTIYCSFTGTSLVAALHRQPLRVDILNTKAFEPMGRYSLVNSLAFVGGLLLGMVFGMDVDSFRYWQTWAMTLPLMVIPFIIFFLNMRQTHRLLAAEKRRELGVVTEQIQRTLTVVRERVTRDEKLGEVAEEYTALVAYEARLRIASTWPYNTGMLRTLFFSILLPVLGRGLSVMLFGR